MNLTAVTSRAAAALVAAVAGFSSYQHIVKVATGAGEHHSVGYVLPLAIDGLIVVGTAALLEDKRANRQPRLSARFALGFGIVATIAANIASAQPTWTARLVAAVPAISFLIAVEVLARAGKPRVATEPATVTPADGALTAIADAIVDAIPPATAATPGPANSTPRRVARKATARPAKGRQSSADLVAKALAKKPDMTQADVVKFLGGGVSLRTVQRNWPKPPATVNGHQPQEA
jgi:hypothetical protein